MASWTLANIISKVRATTGRPDASMMTDAVITDYINRYYQLVMPKEMKIFWGYTYYNFFTIPNVDQYVAPTSFQTLNPRVWFDGFPGDWYLSPDLFYQDYPQQSNKAVVAQSAGVNNFSFGISAYPVLPRSVYVTDGIQIMQDVPAGPAYTTGSFVDSSGSGGSGSINYLNGTVSNLQFISTPTTGVDITQTSQTYQPNRPAGLLYFKSQILTDSTPAVLANVNMFVLRPVPDDVYLVRMQGIQIPAELVNSTDVPFRPDLGPLIAYGASLEIFADFNQMDQYEQAQVQYLRYKDISMQDTYEEYLYQRSVSRF